MVSEKLKTQQMNNDLEKLTHELEKIGLNKERLLHDEQSTDDRWVLSPLWKTMQKKFFSLKHWFFLVLATGYVFVFHPVSGFLHLEKVLEEKNYKSNKDKKCQNVII